MLVPKKVKHRKWQVGRQSIEKRARPETRGITLAFGSFGLKAETQSRITSRQIEAARKAMSRHAGKTAKIWIRIFPDKPVTQKAAEVPMGKGKGDLDHYAMEVRAGRIIFEVDGVSEEIARESLRKACTKLPIRGKVVSRTIA
jgi:large subunit ribosomal protein L16